MTILNLLRKIFNITVSKIRYDMNKVSKGNPTDEKDFELYCMHGEIKLSMGMHW